MDRLDQLRALVLCLKVRWVELWQLLRLRTYTTSGTNTTTTSFFTPPMDPSRLADHLFDPVTGVDSRGQRTFSKTRCSFFSSSFFFWMCWVSSRCTSWFTNNETWRQGYMDNAKADKKGLKRRAGEDPLEATLEATSVPATSGDHYAKLMILAGALLAPPPVPPTTCCLSSPNCPSCTAHGGFSSCCISSSFAASSWQTIDRCCSGRWVPAKLLLQLLRRIR